MLINTVLFGMLPYLTYLMASKIHAFPPSCISDKPLGYIWRKKWKCKRAMPLFMLIFSVIFIGFSYLNYFFLVLLFILPFAIMGMSSTTCLPEQGKYKMVSIFITICLLIFLIGINTFQIQELKNYNIAQKRLFISFHILLFWFLNLEVLALFCRNRNQSDARKTHFPYYGKFPEVFFLTGFLILITFIRVFSRMGFHSQLPLSDLIIKFFSNPVHILNLYFLLFMLTCLWGLFGRGLGLLLSALTIAFLFFSNFLKLRYHDTFFSWFDLLQIKEMFLIGREFLTAKMLILMILLFITLILLLIKYRKIISRLLRPAPSPPIAAISIAALTAMLYMLFHGDFRPLDIYARTWENEKVNVQYNGLIMNQFLNLQNLKNAIIKKPDNYTPEYALQLKKEFKNLDIMPLSQEKPDVILILAESYFDLNNVDGLSLSEDIGQTMRKYSPAKLLSPRFGGYTSAIEFEALTGLYLAFLPNALTPYTTYFNNPEMEFPSIVQEFNNNGYITKAMHPDLPAFYNRTIVYPALGFQDYLALADFELTKENTTENGWLKDDAFGDRIIQELSAEDTPQFIFAMTMEEHYVTLEKYPETEVKLQASGIPEKDRKELEQQAQSYLNTDKMVKKIIDYMNQTDRPTLLYVFGDHLPPIDALGLLSYTNDTYQKYMTGFAMYSNYKEIHVDPEYITPNQIAVQILHDSGITHSSYFDYLYALREQYPVVHKEFINVDGNPDLDLYRFIQYDIMFGKRWLYGCRD